jgi:hypothetical protein
VQALAIQLTKHLAYAESHASSKNAPLPESLYV